MIIKIALRVLRHNDARRHLSVWASRKTRTSTKSKKEKYDNKNSVQQKHKMTKNYCNPSKVRRMNIKTDIYSIVYCKAVETIRYTKYNRNVTPIFFC